MVIAAHHHVQFLYILYSHTISLVCMQRIGDSNIIETIYSQAPENSQVMCSSTQVEYSMARVAHGVAQEH